MPDDLEREALTMHIAQRIREARAGKGWNQARLAMACGWAQPTISLYEDGHRRTGIYELCVLAVKLERPLAFFLDELPGHAALTVREEAQTFCSRPGCTGYQGHECAQSAGAFDAASTITSAHTVGLLAAREEPQACTCRHPPEGVIGWDRGMVDRECPVHGHEALPERPDPQIEKVVEAMRATGEQEAWNDWYPKSPPSKRNAHRHGFNAGQAAGLIEGEAAGREDTERPGERRKLLELTHHEVEMLLTSGNIHYHDVDIFVRDTEREPERS